MTTRGCTGPASLLNTEGTDREGCGEDSDGDGEIDRELIMAAVHGPPNRNENPSCLQGVDGVTVMPCANCEKNFDHYPEDGTLVDDDPSLPIGDVVRGGGPVRYPV